MKQGTVSLLFGCHSIIHSFCVIIAWYKIWHRLPNWWELICILLHDIGHWGKNYLDNVEEKRGHWKLGAKIAGRLVGRRGFEMVAGHDPYSGYPESLLLKPDKYSWLVAPRIWLWTNGWFEPKLRKNGLGRWAFTKYFKNKVKENVESGRFASTHDIYMNQELDA